MGAVVLALLGRALLVVSARVEVPFYPVRITLQPLAVMLIAMTYGTRVGATAVLPYLSEGAVGLPVFQASCGWLR